MPSQPPLPDPDLAAMNESSVELVARLRDELCRRWQEGERVRVESYMAAYPSLNWVCDYAVDLVYSEYLLREELGERPEPTEYLERFPLLAAPLARQFALHEELVALSRSQFEVDGGAAGSDGLDGGRSLAHAATPRSIGRFEIRQRLGVGGFGCVYRAFDPQLGREVALKVPHLHLETDGYRERFLREARAAAQLQHPHLVSVFDAGVSDDGCYIAYQLVPGHSLAELVKRRAFTPEEAASLVHKLSLAAHHAHVHGVFHRDLKTANVLMDDHGNPYISDFGLVRLEGDATLTTEATVLGTPAYMPPEQARGASHLADARSDVYTLGVVLYELLTGRLPFIGPPQVVLRQVLEEDPPLVRTLNRQLPRDLETICSKAMAKRPSERYVTALELAEDLERWSRHEPIRARPTRMVRRLWKWARRRPAAAALVAVTFAAALTLFIVGTWYNVRLRLANLQTQQLLTQAQRLLSQAQAERGVQLLESGDSVGLLHLLEARRTSEGLRQIRDSRSLVWAGWYDACAGRLMQVFGDESPIERVLFTPNDQRLVTASANGARLWDVSAGRPVVHPFNQETIARIALAPNGRFAATFSAEEVPRVWDLASGEPTAVFSRLPETSEVTASAISDDGSWLALASGSEVWLGDVTIGEFFDEPIRHGSDVGQNLVFSPDSKLLAVTTRSGELGIARLWQIDRLARSVRPAGRPLVHDHEIVSLVFSPNGLRVATASRDNSARLWESATGEAVGDAMRHREAVSIVAFSRDGKTLATGSIDGTAQLWNEGTSKPLGQPLRHQGPVRALDFSPDGNLLATGSLDGTVRLWNTAKAQIQGWPLRHPGDVTSVVFSADGRWVVSASADGSARLWKTSVETGPPSRVFPHDGRVYSLALSPKHGKLLVTGAGDGVVRLWDTESGDLQLEPWRYSGEIQCVALGPEGRLVALGPQGGGRNRVEVRDTESGDPVGQPIVTRGELRALAFSPDGQFLATGSSNGHVQLWEVTTGRRSGRSMQTTPGLSGVPVTALAFSADGRLLAAGWADRVVLLWDVELRQRHGPPLWHNGPIDALAFSPDRKLLATASRDLAIRFWQTANGQPLSPTIRPEVITQALAFSPDGQLLATASVDGAARLWDLETGFRCGPPFTHEAFATSVAFTPNGDWLATASFDKTARLWRLPRHLGESNLELMQLRTWVAIGARLDVQGTVEPIAWVEWQRMRDQLAERDPMR